MEEAARAVPPQVAAPVRPAARLPGRAVRERHADEERVAIHSRPVPLGVERRRCSTTPIGDGRARESCRAASELPRELALNEGLARQRVKPNRRECFRGCRITGCLSGHRSRRDRGGDYHDRYARCFPHRSSSLVAWCRSHSYEPPRSWGPRTPAFTNTPWRQSKGDVPLGDGGRSRVICAGAQRVRNEPPWSSGQVHPAVSRGSDLDLVRAKSRCRTWEPPWDGRYPERAVDGVLRPRLSRAAIARRRAAGANDTRR